ncbi:hypothetical protein COLO4_14366 [Corchorus olitorius]|uniref:Uncharacterized protein n=1 Tax=Corchorus olitorius TaxID=93759 RepID=A0A1R3JSW8_9ROSI|nr:hypothetical protein COLO4_14366 [Corchorus olitorius]
MSLGTIYATIPAVVAAAVGIYSFDRQSGPGAKAKVKTAPLPKVAPQFDGLNCFETLVG